MEYLIHFHGLNKGFSNFTIYLRVFSLFVLFLILFYV